MQIWHRKGDINTKYSRKMTITSWNLAYLEFVMSHLIQAYFHKKKSELSKILSNEFRKQIWLGQKSAKWNQIEHALGRKIKFSGFLWSLEDTSLILNLSYVTVQHVYGSALLSYAVSGVSGGFNEGADGRVSTYINILKQ